jgi:hypothetical protein
VAREVGVDAGDKGDVRGGEVLVVERPATFQVDEPNSGAVGLSPRPPGVDAGRGRVLVPLAGVQRVVAGGNRRGRRAGLDVGQFDPRSAATARASFCGSAPCGQATA